jgi:site-specific recombinase XerD
MHGNLLSGELLSSYLGSAHKERLDHVASHLLRKKYLPIVVRQHLHEWVRFARYLEKHDLAVPSFFHAPEVERYLRARFPAGSRSRLRGIRAAVRIFLEMDEDGKFSRRVQAPPRSTNTLYAYAVPGYLEFLRKHRGVSNKTISKRAFQLARFTNYLERAGVVAWKDVQATVLREFLSTQLTERSPLTRLSYASTLRTFHRWAFISGILEQDLSPAATAVRQYRLAGIPDVLTDDEVTELLRAVDRSTTIGKRDYAVLLLAARYGMRPSDIRQLCLDHIQWRDRQIALQQSKTGRPLRLPLLQDVSDALIDYLRNSRPKTECRNIFVRHVAPYEPFAPNNNLPTIFRAALQRARLGHRDGRKGLYLLRHTVATRMLSAGSSLKTIGDVLGHVCLDSTLIYTKVDLGNLKTVALSMEEVLR